MRDWIDHFMDVTSDTNSPEICRKWAAITSLGGALEQRVWTRSKVGPLFPNLYIMLLGGAGSGKSQAIRRIKEMWGGVELLKSTNKKLWIAADSVTPEALIDGMNRAERRIIVPGKEVETFHYLNVASTEFGVLFPAYHHGFLGILTQFFDDEGNFTQDRRSFDEPIDIHRPKLNLVVAATPKAVVENLPPMAWGQGFTARVIFIYVPEGINAGKPLFGDDEDDDPSAEDFNSLSSLKPRVMNQLLRELAERTGYCGRMAWTREAKRHADAWSEEGMPPIPLHSRLKDYNVRRPVHFLKLCTISGMSRHCDLRITIEDTQRAQDWLLEAESRMEDCFREMTGKGDEQVISDLKSWLYAEYARSKRKPIPDNLVWSYLKNHIPAERIRNVLAVAERSGNVKKQNLGGVITWTPFATGVIE